MLTKKPYKVSPYTKMVKLKCPWIAEVKERVTKRISEFEQFIENEAAADNLAAMSDEEYVYKCFKFNVEHNLKYGMIQVLKYFSLRFRIKILYDMIGEWKFTTHDKEIYEHFRSTSYAELGKGAFVKNLTVTSGKMPNIFVHDRKCKWMVTVDKNKEFYTNFFYQEVLMLTDMIHYTKGCRVWLTDRSFFDGKHLHEGLNLSFKINDHLDFGEYKNIEV